MSELGTQGVQSDRGKNSQGGVTWLPSHSWKTVENGQTLFFLTKILVFRPGADVSVVAVGMTLCTRYLSLLLCGLYPPISVTFKMSST